MTLDDEIDVAVRHFWRTRASQALHGSEDELSDGRQAVTGGKHLDEFARLVTRRIVEAGVEPTEIFWSQRNRDLPGYFRATKDWDLIVVRKGRLLAVLEMSHKSGRSETT